MRAQTEAGRKGRSGARSRWFAVLVPILALAGVLSWGSVGAEQRRPGVVELEPWRYLRLEGQCESRQLVEAGVGLGVEFDVVVESWTLTPGEGAPGSEVSPRVRPAESGVVVLLRRELRPRLEGGVFHGGRSLTAWRVVAGAEGRSELVALPGGRALPTALESYLPVDATLSTRSLEGSAPRGREGDVGGVRVRIGLEELVLDDVTQRLGADGAVELRAELPQGGKASSSGAARVLEWSERRGYAKDRGLLRAVERRLVLETRGLRSLQALSLRVTTHRTLAPSERQALSQATSDLLACVEASGALEASAGAEPPNPRPRLRELRGTLDAPVFRGLVAELDASIRERFPTPEARPRDGGGRIVELGSQAPDFVLPDLWGDRVAFRDLIEGKVAYLTFWGVGCSVCRVEAPVLSRLQRAQGERGFIVVAVNAWGEKADAVREWVKGQALEQTVLLDGRAVAKRQYAVRGYPTGYWIDHEGKVVGQEVGFRREREPEIEARLERLLEARERSRR